MTQKLLQSSAVLLFLLCAFGWGRLTRRFFDRRIFVFHSLTAILGLAVLGFLGGLLNCLHAARAPGWLLLLAVGLGATAHDLYRRRPWLQRTFALGSIPLFVAPVIALAASLLLLPTDVFNVADDFHTYFTRATRMAQTGSLAGNAFDSLGVDSLGSAAFFHGFFFLAGGVELLNGFDAVACFALCQLLLAELSLRWRIPWWLGVACLLGLVWINPQYANISPLYAGAAGVMALMVCGLLLAHTLVRRRKNSGTRLALAMGLLAAWLVTLKLTLAAFVAMDLSLLFLLLLVAASNRRAVIQTAGVLVSTIGVGVLPWALVSLPDLVRARSAAAPLILRAPLAQKYALLPAHESALLFHRKALAYGDTPVLYLGLSAVALALGVAGVAHWLRHRSDGRSSGALAVTAGGAALCATLLLNSHLYPIGMAIRYACPIVIGGVFASVLMFVRSRTPPLASSRRWLSAGLAVGCVALMAAFNETFLERLDTARQWRTLLVYGASPSDYAYSRDSLTSEQARYHASLQAKIPSGATALVWTSTPFHFDFARNHLLTLTAPGISSPALRFPAGLTAGDLERYLYNNGVQFVILETGASREPGLAGLAMMQRFRSDIFRKIGDFGAYLRESLDRLAARGQVLYADDRMLIFEIGRGSVAHKASPPAASQRVPPPQP